MTDEEEVTAELLRLAGAPADASPERAARVREAVHRQWRADRERRRVRRVAAGVIAVCGVAAMILLLVWIARPGAPPAAPAQVIATALRVQGAPSVRRLSRAGALTEPVSTATAVSAGDEVITSSASRVALQTIDGASVRLDRDTSIRLVASTVIQVIRGAVYVSTARPSHGFDVRTPLGTVRDIGTRFEVRVVGPAVRVRVRQGVVQLRDTTRVPAGTEAMMTATGIALGTVLPYGTAWEWTADVSPPFPIEGQSLAAFLDHLANEQHWTVRYAAPDAASAARGVTLHGSVDGLSSEDALRSVLKTTGFRYRLDQGDLLVSREAQR